MNIIHKFFLGLALAAGLNTSASATVIQTTAPTVFNSSSSWTGAVLGSITFAKNTNRIDSLFATATVWDQGSGFAIPSYNNVYLALFKDGTEVWDDVFAGATHTVTTDTFNSKNEAAAMASLNSIMASLDWTKTSNVTMQLLASPLGLPGFALHVTNASFSTTSSSPIVTPGGTVIPASGTAPVVVTLPSSALVPEPGSVMLMGLGLGIVALLRRKMTKPRPEAKQPSAD